MGSRRPCHLRRSATFQYQFLNLRKISNPRYLSFYSGIREKIRQRARLYENNLELMNNSEFQEGGHT